MTNQVNRRRFLRGSGVCITLPLMESFLSHESVAIEKASQAKRLAVVTVPFGMVVDQFHPSETGFDYKLTPTLKPLEKVRNDFTVFSNLDHDVKGGHAGNHALLSGVKSTERAGYKDGNITIDQFAAELVGHQTRFPSLVFWDEGMCYTRTGVRVPALTKPSDAFKLMFINDSEEQKKSDHDSLKSSGSILDTVLEDAKSLKTDLSSNDRKKLEEFFTSVRETEKKIELSKDWIDRPKPKVGKELQKVADGSRDEKVGGNFVEIWLDLMFLALQTESTRVATMTVENCNWGLPEVTESYHTLSHHGQREDKLTQLAIVEQFLMKNYANFIQRLKAEKQPDGSSMLDSTQLLFGSGMGSGNRHSNTNLPILLAGGKWKHGQHVDGQRKEPLCNLYLSILQQMGAEKDYFNRSNGTLTGLESQA